MRRIAASLLVPIVACAALAACGGSSGSTDANKTVTVSGAFDKAPKIIIPAQAPTGTLSYSTAIKGTGSALIAGDVTLANVVLYKWSGKTHTLVDSTFTSGVNSGPQLIPTSIGLTGLAKALKGQHIGSRVLAVLPPKDGYGTSGNTNLGVTGKDTLVWVIDLLQQFSPSDSATGPQTANGGGKLPTVSAPKAGAEPVITVPKTAAPSKLSVTTLIQGTGPALTKGETVVAQYVGVNWRTGKVFSASWPSTAQPTGEPFSFQLGGQVITGWNDALPGVHVGSRVMLVVPPALGYGPVGGQASAGIKKTDSLVFVIDILAVHSPS
jgi:FKBP-type peptidyl-prolyl cis-trans isomerase